MKRKIFTLLLAIGVLTAFQANAQQRQKIRILADTSGLANTKLESGASRNDSFPFTKTNLYRWLSVSDDGKLVVRSVANEKDTLNGGHRKELYKDQSAVFELDFDKTDSTNFKFFIPGAAASDPLTLKNEATGGVSSYFEIIHLTSGSKVGGTKSRYEGGYVKSEVASNTGGYLVSVPAGIATLKLDTTEFSFVGADKDGKLSLKKLSDFAFYGDSVSYAPYMTYQFTKDFDPGKLYQSDLSPYFQIYDKDGTTPLIHRETNKPNNWGNITRTNPNPNDSIVYSWIDIKLSGDSALVLLGTTIRLDSIVNFTDTLTSLYSPHYGFMPKYYEEIIDTSKNDARKWRGLGTTSLHRDSIKPFRYHINDSDSAYHVYLKNENGSLSFTVKTDSGSNENNWTNGYPTKFTKDSLYYRIDTMMISILTGIIREYVSRDSVENGWSYGAVDSLFHPSQNHISRYLYKNNDDSWRPLYVKLDSVNTEAEAAKIPAEYAGWEWVKENRYNLSAAVQRIAGRDNFFISNEDEGASLTSDTEKEAKFQFEKADTIEAGTIKGYYAKKDGGVTGEPKFTAEGETVELFRIKNGNDGKYLTVLRTTEFAEVGPLTVTNTQVGWHEDFDKSGVDSIERARQWFAIAYNYVDENIALLPVASYQGHLDRTTVTYDDTLTFNLDLGRTVLGKDVDFTKVWYLASNSNPGEDHKLVVAKEGLTRVWFKLDRGNLSEWTNEGNYTYVSIKKGEKYHRGDSSSLPVTDLKNDIRAHWKISKVDKVDGQTVTNAWKFTPTVVTINTVAQGKFRFATDTVYTFKGEGDSVLLVNQELDTVLDIVSVGEVKPSQFSLFDTLSAKHVTILGAGSYIALDSTQTQDNDSIYLASYEAVDEKDKGNKVKVMENYVQYLGSDNLYPVKYYIFSITAKNGKEYFLNAGDRNVRWVSLSSADLSALEKNDNASEYSSYKFALPKFTEGVYLQTADTAQGESPRVIGFANVKKLVVEEVPDLLKEAGMETEDGIYSAVDFYNKGWNEELIAWHFSNASINPEDWASGDDLPFENETDDEVLVSLDVAGGVSVGYDADNKGILLSKGSPTTSLTLRKSKSSAEHQAALRSDAGDEEVETYHIIGSNGLYLSAKATDNYATFTEDAAQAFAFKKSGEGNFEIVLAADIDEELPRHLSTKGINLIFTDADDDHLLFTVNTEGVTAIKAITAPGKIYGVAGGVKVSGATGAVAIYTVDGRLVTKKAVTSPNQTIAVPAGIYVVRNGAEVTKVVVK